MLPTITRLKTPIKNGGEITRWVVEGENYGWDVYDALWDAVKRWIKVVFSSKKSNSKSVHTPPKFNADKRKTIAKRRKKNKNKKTHR